MNKNVRKRKTYQIELIKITNFSSLNIVKMMKDIQTKKKY